MVSHLKQKKKKMISFRKKKGEIELIFNFFYTFFFITLKKM